jgi:hypothetical protein
MLTINGLSIEETTIAPNPPLAPTRNKDKIDE